MEKVNNKEVSFAETVKIELHVEDDDSNDTYLIIDEDEIKNNQMDVLLSQMIMMMMMMTFHYCKFAMVRGWSITELTNEQKITQNQMNLTVIHRNIQNFRLLLNLLLALLMIYLKVPFIVKMVMVKLVKQLVRQLVWKFQMLVLI